MAKKRFTAGGTPMGTFRCKRCKRTFSMAAHLARHMSTVHATAGKRKKKAMAGKRKIKRRGGRPKGIAGRVGLSSMSLDQLGAVIDTARAEARNRLRELEAGL